MLTRRSLAPIATFTVIELIIVGGLGAWIADRLHFSYGYLTPVAMFVSGAAGFYGRRAGAAGWLCGGMVSVFDALSWATFGGVGPQPTDPHATVGAMTIAVAFAVAIGVLSGAIGGWLATRREPLPLSARQ